MKNFKTSYNQIDLDRLCILAAFCGRVEPKCKNLKGQPQSMPRRASGPLCPSIRPVWEQYCDPSTIADPEARSSEVPTTADGYMAPQIEKLAHGFAAVQDTDIYLSGKRGAPLAYNAPTPACASAQMLSGEANGFVTMYSDGLNKAVNKSTMDITAAVRLMGSAQASATSGACYDERALLASLLNVTNRLSASVRDVSKCLTNVAKILRTSDCALATDVAGPGDNVVPGLGTVPNPAPATADAAPAVQ
jgi:hypothetical protein